jgi:AcrR family transcriptional regulator
MARRSTVRSAGQRKQRGEPVVRKVLAVTLEQLAVHGFERLSVPEVAALAGLNKTSVYRRWPTKGDLVRDALGTSMGHAREVPDTGDLRSDLLELARVAVGFVESPQGMGVLRTLFAEGANPEVRELAGAMLRQQDTEGPRRVFKRAIARGELPEDTDVRLLLTTIAGALMHRLFVEQQRVTEAFLQRLIDLVLLGAKKR